jgi:hypothetical protein
VRERSKLLTASFQVCWLGVGWRREEEGRVREREERRKRKKRLIISRFRAGVLPRRAPTSRGRVDRGLMHAAGFLAT